MPNHILFHSFGTEDPLAALLAARPRDPRFRYVRSYLRGIGAVSVLEERRYFDRDYLSEYAAYYAASAAGYGNVCRRLHFFSSAVTEDRFLAALSGKSKEHELQESYLGFTVLRPLPFAPLGRTVLRWYLGEVDGPPGIIAPTRKYRTHLAGLTLCVKGLAWQQQDAAVSRCATVALWSMLHSSGLDEHHSVPTTAAVSLAAFDQVFLGRQPFQGIGLTNPQMCGAVSALGFAPVQIKGDIVDKKGNVAGFSRDAFSVACATFVLSNYTVVMTGRYVTTSREHHAVCLVGYHPDASGGIGAVFVHDDNLGPAARFVLPPHKAAKQNEPLVLMRGVPPSLANDEDPVSDFPGFVPMGMIVAVHSEIRIAPQTAWSIQEKLRRELAKRLSGSINVNACFIRASEYLGSYVDQLFEPPERAHVRSILAGRQLSLFLLVIRASSVGASGEKPIGDWIYDTTTGAHHAPLIASVCAHADSSSIDMFQASIVDPFH